MARVCPECGEPAGSQPFCASCGRNLSHQERLPTREAWEAERAFEGLIRLLHGPEGLSPMAVCVMPSGGAQRREKLKFGLAFGLSARRTSSTERALR